MCEPSIRTFLAAALAIAFGAFGCHQLDFSPRFEKGEIDIFDDLFSVSVADEKHGVAVGYYGTVYWTDDGGETWNKGITDTSRLLYSVSMADAQYGWAVGQMGTILRTEDGGASWLKQPNLKGEQGSHLFAVHAVDPSTAWVVGEWGTRILTEDGGKTWQDRSLTVDMQHPQFVWLSFQDQDRVRQGQKVYEDVGLNDIFCLPAPGERCWMIGEFGYIFYSEDRGVTWNRSEILGEIRTDPIYFAYDEIEIADGDVARLEEFAAAVADEQHLNILVDPFVSPREVATLIEAGDPSGLFDVIEARLAEVTSVLEEAGILTDRLRKPNKPPWDFEDFVEDDATFLERYLEGRTSVRPMLRVGIIQNPYLFTVRFQDDENGFIAGLGGVILRSQDGGRSWTYQDTGRKQAFYSVSSGNGHAVAVGEKGLVRYSGDGGDTWRAPAERDFPQIFTFMRDLDFDGHQRVGFIVGQEGMVLRSVDGGNTWSQVLPPAEDGKGA